MLKVILGISLITGLVLFSCGKDDDSSSGGEELASGEITDETTPLALQIESGDLAGSSLEIPAGALPVGAKVVVSAVTAPDKFVENTDVTPASATMGISVTDAEGADIPAPASAMTLAIALNDPPTALAGSADDLCVFQAIPPDEYLVFRDDNIAFADGVTTINPTAFGKFQATYCADLELAGFKVPGEEDDGGGDDVVENPFEGDLAAFFEAVKGDHKWIATDTNLTGGGFWTHGETYEIKVKVDGNISVAQDEGDPIVVTFDKDSDSFEKYDHEEYIIMERDGAKYLLQHQGETLVLTWQKGVYPDGKFWRFDTKGPTGTEGPLGDKAPFATGTFDVTISNVNTVGDVTTEYAENDTASVAIDVYAKGSGTFGDFVHDSSTQKMDSTINQVPNYTITWYKPDGNTYPREELQMKYEAEVFKGGFYRKATDASNGVYYNFLKTEE